MSELSFRLASWTGWSDGALITQEAPLRTTKLPPAFRRRATDIGRRAMDAAWAVMPEGASPRLVLSSRHGEYRRTFSLLDALAADGAVSPADFSMSVHHALTGLLSIAAANRAGHSAIAAGPESLGYGLLEAAACLAADPAVPVVLIHAEESLPDPYHSLVAAESPVALALRLESPGGTAGPLLSVRLDAGDDPAASPPQPLAPAFIDFLQSGAPTRMVCGERMRWTWRHVAD